jgi:Tfp pilus assembly protein PilN
VKAVNLIPSESRRIGRGPAGLPQGPGFVLLGLLAIAVLFVTLYVLAANTISQRKATLASLQAQVAQAQGATQRLGNYAQFAQLAQAREQTVRQIAATRFDWHGVLSDLSKVVPAKTALLSSLTGSVAPGAGVEGMGAGGSTGGLRNAISSPALQLSGCTKTQDEVARLMSRLRLVNGVSRVTLADSVKADTQSGVSSGSTQSSNCPYPVQYDLVMFFNPLPGAGPMGPAAATGSTGPTAPTAPAAPAGQPVSNSTSTQGGTK